MAKALEAYINELRETRLWRSVFRSGTGATNLHRALAVQQNIFPAPVLGEDAAGGAELQRHLVPGNAEPGDISDPGSHRRFR